MSFVFRNFVADKGFTLNVFFFASRMIHGDDGVMMEKRVSIYVYTLFHFISCFISN